MNDENRNIVFFDSTCLLCNQSVQFLLQHDKEDYLYFATLQSDVAKRVLLQAPKNILQQDSIIFFCKGKYYTASDAILKIANILGGKFLIGQIFYIIPKPLRDFIYRLIAKNRYRWFGQTDSCLLLNKRQQHKFL